MAMMSASSISRLELGETMVSVFSILKIADALNAPISEILTDITQNEFDYAELLGITEKLKKIEPKQRVELVRCLEQFVDLLLQNMI